MMSEEKTNYIEAADGFSLPQLSDATARKITMLVVEAADTGICWFIIFAIGHLCVVAIAIFLLSLLTEKLGDGIMLGPSAKYTKHYQYECEWSCVIDPPESLASNFTFTCHTAPDSSAAFWSLMSALLMYGIGSVWFMIFVCRVRTCRMKSELSGLLRYTNGDKRSLELRVFLKAYEEQFSQAVALADREDRTTLTTLEAKVSEFNRFILKKYDAGTSKQSEGGVGSLFKNAQDLDVPSLQLKAVDSSMDSKKIIKVLKHNQVTLAALSKQVAVLESAKQDVEDAFKKFKDLVVEENRIINSEIDAIGATEQDIPDDIADPYDEYLCILPSMTLTRGDLRQADTATPQPATSNPPTPTATITAPLQPSTAGTPMQTDATSAPTRPQYSAI
jgi:hypothetical protein